MGTALWPLGTLGVCVSMWVPNTASGDSLTRCPGIVEANPRKFNLDATELGIRKAFITSTRQVVRVRNLALGSGPGEGGRGDKVVRKGKPVAILWWTGEQRTNLLPAESQACSSSPCAPSWSCPDGFGGCRCSWNSLLLRC